MIDPNFDPYQELIDAHIEINLIKQSFLSLVEAHNKLNHNYHQLRRELAELRTYQQGFQILLAKIDHKLDCLEKK